MATLPDKIEFEMRIENDALKAFIEAVRDAAVKASNEGFEKVLSELNSKKV